MSGHPIDFSDTKKLIQELYDLIDVSDITFKKEQGELEHPRPVLTIKRKNIFQRLFCDHHFIFHHHIHGDSINYLNGKRTVRICKKCGKFEYSSKYDRQETRNFNIELT